MKKNNPLHIASVLFFIQFSFGQNTVSREITGQILEGTSSRKNVTIVNASSDVSVVSNENGFFKIQVNKGDVLVFSHENLKTLEIKIQSEDFKKELFVVEMHSKEIALKEVIVNSNITAENLGIIPKNQKKYTPAERKLKVAGDFKPVMLLGLLGGSMPVDPLLNKINGRTKKLKELVALEQKEQNIEKLGLLFDDGYFIDCLKIPLEHVDGFKFYVVENETAGPLLKLNDKSKLAPFLGEMALKFNEMLAFENK